MPTTTAIRLFLVFALISLTGFFAAGATAGGTVPVLIGALGLLAAVSLTAAIDTSTPRAA